MNHNPIETCQCVIIYRKSWHSSNTYSSSCGHPAFQILCSDDGSVAALRSSAIHVLGIDYANNSFIVSHTRVSAVNGVCRTDFNMSSSIALSPFTISRRNRALCFLYNCNGTEPHGRGYVNVTSNCSTPIFAYLGGSYYWDSPPPIATGRCSYTYMPVLRAEAAVMTAASYTRLLKDGFVLEWETDTIGNCAACIATGGECRYDNDAVAFACLCPDGRLRARAGSTCAGESICIMRRGVHAQLRR
ncbi:LEAF RUST 10 DISEASE-RESISTANCE LOCUS RECEPTOR-LIKE PROTEIN KINASE-like 2.1 [Phragmites australis]|uniref:LEAF RUST 10 DISEASE-RESISTANCE LOCUS RECEPTOR-LIKE PROTEIN KINASE-like 2.1 n=1 Tax=Phragmites australis TaxID=29695 RepID=UPI002D792EAD|nr:LEAF RUST 10 DISEASE-RESISTANCE LOCUS RECEPTOR-LIKE PROTEIN KINASE-like 2.1 [Phragmites australis]